MSVKKEYKLILEFDEEPDEEDLENNLMDCANIMTDEVYDCNSAEIMPLKTDDQKAYIVLLDWIDSNKCVKQTLCESIGYSDRCDDPNNYCCDCIKEFLLKRNI